MGNYLNANDLGAKGKAQNLVMFHGAGLLLGEAENGRTNLTAGEHDR